MEEHGDAKLTDLLVTLADCQKARSASIHDRCKAVYEGLLTHILLANGRLHVAVDGAVYAFVY
jgi:hypothetical protein